VEKYIIAGSPEMTIWRICIACSIPKATDSHSEYATFIVSPLQQWLQRLNVTLYAHGLSSLFNVC